MNVKFCTGVMGSGKSNQLIEDFVFSKARRVAVSVQLTNEIGTLGKIESRNGKSLVSLNVNSKEPDESISYLKNIFAVGDLEEIYIDEIQFLSSRTVEQIIELSEKENVSIYFYGLETNFLNEYFESSRFLLEAIDESNIKRLPLFCQKTDCKNLASHNARISEGKVSRTGEVFVSEKMNTYLSALLIILNRIREYEISPLGLIFLPIFVFFYTKLDYN